MFVLLKRNLDYDIYHYSLQVIVIRHIFNAKIIGYKKIIGC